MSVTSTRTLQLGFSGDVAYQQPFSATDNPASSGEIQVVSLTTGVNTFIPPTVNGIVNDALTIIPPSGNTVLITLKGASGDTGIPLHLVDPTSIGIDTTFAQVVLTVASGIDGVRLIWS